MTALTQAAPASHEPATVAAADPGGPALPTPRGPLSEAVVEFMRGRRRRPLAAAVGDVDPYGEDLQLALYACYELHYRGFAGADDALEWDPDLLALRARLEQAFLTEVRAQVAGGDDLAAAVAALLVEPIDGTGISHHLCSEQGQLWQFREYVAMRSLYHLKEADPQAWVIPRLEGPAKSALVTVEHDEYGAGKGHAMHSLLFANMMRELGLSTRYGAYLDQVPAEVLAEVNLMSLCGLHRALRGASIGQFAVIELTSSPGSARLVKAGQRLGCGPATHRYYDEHVEADAVHEQILRRNVLAPLVAEYPAMAADIVFGIQASELLADRLAGRIKTAWSQGRSALLTPLA